MIFGLLPMVILGGIAMNLASSSLTQLATDKLSAIRDGRAAAIETYFGNSFRDINSMAAQPAVVEAMSEFSKAYNQFNDDNNIASIDSYKIGLAEYYNQQFSPEYKKQHNGDSAPIKQMMNGMSDTALTMQYHYIHANNHPLGSKNNLLRANDDSTYSNVHEKHHELFNGVLQRYGYYDIFLVEPNNGNIVYSVFKELDFATSLKNGPYKDTNFADVYRKVVSTEKIVVEDYKQYLPSYNAAASFVGVPIKKQNVLIGVLIYQLPFDPIQEIMKNRDGLGKLGDAYLVGGDYLPRSDSSLDKPAFTLQSSFNEPDTHKLKSEAVELVFSEKSGSTVASNYKNEENLSSFKALSIKGLDWYIVADVPVTEALTAVDSLVSASFLVGVSAVICVIVFGLLISKAIANPITQLAKLINNTEEMGNFSASSNYVGRDEVGQIASATNKLLSNLQGVFTEVSQVLVNTSQGQPGQQVKLNMAGDVASLITNVNNAVTQIEKSNQEASQQQALATSQSEKAKQAAEEANRLAEQAQAQAAESARIKSALDKCQANVMMADVDLNIIYINDSVKEMMAANQKQLQTVLPNFNINTLVGTNVDDFHKKPAHQRHLLSQLTQAYETRLNIAGLTFDLIATPVFSDNGERLGTVVEWDDVTERLASETKAAEIAAHNARIKVALDKCQANVMLADNDFNIIYLNESVAQMMKGNEVKIKASLPKFNVDNLLGTCIDDFHKKASHQRGLLNELKDVYKTCIKISGLSFDLVATPVFDNGERLGTIVEWSDMTEALALQEQEQALANENSRIRQALDTVSTNTMIANDTNEIIYMNEAIHNMMNIAESDIKKVLPNFEARNLVGQTMDVFHRNPAHQHRLIENLSSTYKTQINVGVRTFTLVANPITNGDGQRIGTVVEWGDRTAEVAIEKEIDNLVDSAAAGDLTTRIETDNKEGFFKGLGEGLNRLVGVCEGVISDTVEMLDAMAHGNLTKRIEGDYDGTFGKLKEDANATVTKLTEIIARVNQSANTVASGADEIAQGNADLSQRTEEQASSLEETASSMEEMTSTVKQNADNALVANQLAADAQSKAAEGGEVVGKAVTSMSEINESSKKIADIISVIDEIAFQTNLLALNAAVEAARAGEQGRGFAVVAGEVRNLAGRSAEAAKEIKDLIRDSVAKVEDGSALVNQSGETLTEIVAAVEKVNQMIGDISVASREQSSGIEQVNKAVAQMDEMTQQNAALVEEASAAGESMAEQAKAMNQLLSFFTVEAGHDSQHVEYLGTMSATAKPAFKAQAKKAEIAPPAPVKQSNTGLSFSGDDEEWEEF